MQYPVSDLTLTEKIKVVIEVKDEEGGHVTELQVGGVGGVGGVGVGGGCYINC